MISNEDFECITALDDKRSKHIEQYPDQCAKTLINLLTHVSKDQTIQYVLVLIDDILQEDRARVEMFISYGIKRKESIWSPFLNLLNRQDGFIVNMSANILAKLACCGSEQMNKADLNFYLQWLKDQLTNQVSGLCRVGIGWALNLTNHRSTRMDLYLEIFGTANCKSSRKLYCQSQYT